jgi:hypothetical protein
LRVYILDASRTSGERRATIIVGDAMRGAAWVATPLLVMALEIELHRLTEPSSSAIAVEVVDLRKLISFPSYRADNAAASANIHPW